MSTLCYHHLPEITTYLDHGNTNKISLAYECGDDDLIKYCNLKSDFHSKIITRLELLGLADAAQFIEIIKNTGGCIAGSLILQLLLNEYWPTSDIDIYTQDVKNLSAEIFKLYPLDGVKIISRQGYAGTVLVNTGGRAIPRPLYEYRDPKPINIGKVFDFNYSDKLKIQIIEMNDNTTDFNNHMLNYIKRTYDFDFCKNMYNGNELYIIKPQSIINKVTDLNNLECPSCDLSRIIKYTNRGFTINNVDKYCSKLLSISSLKQMAVKHGTQPDTASWSIANHLKHYLYKYLVSIEFSINMTEYKNKLVKTENNEWPYLVGDDITDTFHNTKQLPGISQMVINNILYRTYTMKNFDESFYEFQNDLFINRNHPEILTKLTNEWFMFLLDNMKL